MCYQHRTTRARIRAGKDHQHWIDGLVGLVGLARNPSRESELGLRGNPGCCSGSLANCCYDSPTGSSWRCCSNCRRDSRASSLCRCSSVARPEVLRRAWRSKLKLEFKNNPPHSQLPRPSEYLRACHTRVVACHTSIQIRKRLPQGLSNSAGNRSHR